MQNISSGENILQLAHITSASISCQSIYTFHHHPSGTHKTIVVNLILYCIHHSDSDSEHNTAAHNWPSTTEVRHCEAIRNYQRLHGNRIFVVSLYGVFTIYMARDHWPEFVTCWCHHVTLTNTKLPPRLIMLGFGCRVTLQTKVNIQDELHSTVIKSQSKGLWNPQIRFVAAAELKMLVRCKHRSQISLGMG